MEERTRIYLDNAATTFPKLPEIQDVIKNYCNNFNQSPNRTNSSDILGNIRKKILRYFDATNDYDLAFVPSATIGMNIVINTFSKDKNNKIITTNCEHHCVYRPLEEYGISYKIVEYMDINQEEHKEKILNEINENTTAVIMNHGSNVTGNIYDIESVGKGIKKISNNTLFIVDISQTAGFEDISINDIKADIIIGSAHKHLYAMPGIGYIIYKKGLELEPIYYGGTGKISSSMKQPRIMPDMLEVGTMNIVGILALEKSIEVITKELRKKYRKHENDLVSYFLEKSKLIKGIKVYCGKENRRTGVISFKIDELDSNYVVAPYLQNEGNISVRSGLHCAPIIHKTLKTFPEGTVRISFSYNNTKEDVDKLIYLLMKL